MSVNFNMDKRIIKSKQKIKEKYLELLFKKDPSKIQVNELCALAHVNRSTFYERYGYLDALVDEIIEEQLINVSFDKYDEKEEVTSIEQIEKEQIKQYIQKFYANKILVKFCLAENKEIYVGKIIQKQIAIGVKELNKISYYQALFQTVGALTVLIDFLTNKKSQSIDDVVNVVYEHALVMLKEEFQ